MPSVPGRSSGVPAAARRPRVPKAPVLATGIGYAACYLLVQAVTSFGSSVGATFWPGAGVTVAALLLRPRREWPWLLGIVAAVEFSLDVRAGFGLALSASWALANTAEPLLAAWLLTRGGRPAPDLGNRHDLGRFVAAAVVAGPLLGATIGTLTAALINGDPIWPRLPRWFVGDGIGVLVIAPFVMFAATARFGRAQGGRPRATAALLWILALVSVLALGPWDFAGSTGLPFLVLPALVLVAVRLHAPGAAAGVVVVALIVEGVTAAGYGPFAGSGALEGLVVAQMFLAMSAFTALTTGALMNDLVSREEMEETLRRQALHDSLTGLANRRLLFDRIEVASRRLERSPGTLALLFVDLDGFKSVNDTLGHSAGDAVLVEAARRLEGAVRAGDTVARFGGDEFIVLAEGMSGIEDARALAERAGSALSKPMEWRGMPVSITGSIGIAVADAPIDDIEGFVVGADRAMYAAKTSRGAARAPVAEPIVLR